MTASRGEGRQLPASWAPAKLSLLEGGTVCTWDGDKNAYLTYNGTEYFELHDEYAERLTPLVQCRNIPASLPPRVRSRP